MPATEPPSTNRPKVGEVTGRQGGALVSGFEVPGLSIAPRGTYATYRRMREHPTIALARAVVMGPVIGGSWSFEAKDGVADEVVEFISEQIEPMRTHIVRESLRALDYGWQGFEKIFDVVDGRLRLRKLKPLLHDKTQILANRDTGRFEGFRQDKADVPLEKALLFVHDREGDDFYGRARLENVRFVWSAWLDAAEAAARYDRKIAGVMPVVHYPPGESYDRSGALVSNATLAQRLLDNLASGKGVAIENQFLAFVDDRDADAKERRQWMIDLLEDKGSRQPGFVDRLRYLDSQIFRGMLRPERSALEGQSGTKAEAGEHGDVGLTDGETLHQDIAEMVNWHVIDQLLALNFGEDARGSVFVTPTPLQDRKRALVLGLLSEWGRSPDGREDLRLWLDFDAVLDMAELPKSAEVVNTADRDVSTGDDDPPDPSLFTGPLAEQMRQLMAQSRQS